MIWAYLVPCYFLQKTDLVPKRERTRLEGLLQRLNPRAVVVQTVRGVVALSHIVNTHRFDMEAAQQGAGWLAVGSSPALPTTSPLCLDFVFFLPNTCRFARPSSRAPADWWQVHPCPTPPRFDMADALQGAGWLAVCHRTVPHLLRYPPSPSHFTPTARC